MKIADIVKYERGFDRETNIMRLYKEGVWYRAYEWSAYLAHFFPNGLTEVQRLRPTHRDNKEYGDLICVGLKLDMCAKFLPNVAPIMNEDYVDFVVDLSQYNLESADYDVLLKSWKDAIPIKEEPKAKNKVPQIYSHPMTFSAIMKAIISFPLESKTPDEAFKFVRELKDMVAQLI